MTPVWRCVPLSPAAESLLDAAECPVSAPALRKLVEGAMFHARDYRCRV